MSDRLYIKFKQAKKSTKVSSSTDADLEYF